MARDISELGADVFDDTIVVDNKKMSPKKRNYIIGLSLTGFFLTGAIVASVILCNTVLLDYQNVTNVSYYFTPETALAPGEEPVAVLYRLQSDVTYPSTFRIPSQVKGYKVVGVAESAFAGHEEIKHVIFPNTVTFVRENAFANCTNLAKFTWSKNLTDIGVDAFINTEFYNDLLSNSNTFYDLPSGVLIYVGEDYLPQGIALVSDELPESEYANIQSAYGSSSVKKFSEYDIKNFTSGAFRNNNKITYIDLPKNIEIVSNSTFEGCINLKGIDTTHSELKTIGTRAFADCIKLHDIKLKDDIELINDEAFSNIALTDSLPNINGVTSFGTGVFSDCASLTGFTYELNYVPDYMFSGCTSLATVEWGEDNSNTDSIKTFGMGVFQNTGFSEFMIPKNITEIKDETFDSCLQLEKVLFYGNPNEEFVESEETFIDKNGNEQSGTLKGVNTIKALAFNNCRNLQTITLYDDDGIEYPDTVVGEFHLPNSLIRTDGATTIAGNDNSVFRGTSVQTIQISPNLKSIGSYAFADCESAEHVTFIYPEKSRLANIKNNAFMNCTSLLSIDLPDTVTTIGPSIFKGCTSIEHIGFSNIKAISLPSETFFGCESLQEITLPNTITNIKSYAFSKNYALNYVIVPNSVNEIQSKAFTNMRTGEEKFNVFLSWTYSHPGQTKNISSTWKDATVQEFYLLADGEQMVAGRNYWRLNSSNQPEIIPNP